MFRVSITEYGVVEVRGGTLQQIVDLLQAGGNQVVIDKDLVASGSSGPDPAKDLGQLSERKMQVLTLIATGLSNTEVANEMYASVNTVKSYIRSCYGKIRVQSRSQAVIWAIDHEIVIAHPDDN